MLSLSLLVLVDLRSSSIKSLVFLFQNPRSATEILYSGSRQLVSNVVSLVSFTLYTEFIQAETARYSTFVTPQTVKIKQRDRLKFYGVNLTGTSI